LFIYLLFRVQFKQYDNIIQILLKSNI